MRLRRIETYVSHDLFTVERDVNMTLNSLDAYEKPEVTIDVNIFTGEFYGVVKIFS